MALKSKSKQRKSFVHKDGGDMRERKMVVAVVVRSSVKIIFPLVWACFDFILSLTVFPALCVFAYVLRHFSDTSILRRLSSASHEMHAIQPEMYSHVWIITSAMLECIFMHSLSFSLPLAHELAEMEEIFARKKESALVDVP